MDATKSMQSMLSALNGSMTSNELNDYDVGFGATETWLSAKSKGKEEAECCARTKTCWARILQVCQSSSPVDSNPIWADWFEFEKKMEKKKLQVLKLNFHAELSAKKRMNIL